MIHEIRPSISKASDSCWEKSRLNPTILRLAADIYASRAHFVLELLQNADDNEYAPGWGSGAKISAGKGGFQHGSSARISQKMRKNSPKVDEFWNQDVTHVHLETHEMCFTRMVFSQKFQLSKMRVFLALVFCWPVWFKRFFLSRNHKSFVRTKKRKLNEIACHNIVMVGWTWWNATMEYGNFPLEVLLQLDLIYEFYGQNQSSDVVLEILCWWMQCAFRAVGDDDDDDDDDDDEEEEEE